MALPGRRCKTHGQSAVLFRFRANRRSRAHQIALCLPVVVNNFGNTIYGSMADLTKNLDAESRIFLQEDGTYAVEIRMPDSFPTTVTSFTTEAAAESWVENYRTRVEAVRAGGKRIRRARSA